MQRHHSSMPCRTQGNSLRETSRMLQFSMMSNMFIFADVQEDVKVFSSDVLFADVLQDVKVSRSDANFDAKDQAVLSCNHAPAESSSNSKPRDPHDRAQSATLPGDAFAARPCGSMASLRRQGDGCVANAPKAEFPEDADGVASHGASLNSNLCGHPHAVCGRLPGEQKPRNNRHQCFLRPQKQSKKDAQTETKVRRGIGRPLPRSTASKEWQFEPSACVHSEEPVAPARVEEQFLVDLPWMRQPLAETGVGDGPTGEFQRSSWVIDRSGKVTSKDFADKFKCGLSGPIASTSIPARLKSPADSRPGSTVMCEPHSAPADGRDDGRGGQVADDSRREDDSGANHSSQDKANGRSTTGTTAPEECQGEGKPQEDVFRGDPCTASQLVQERHSLQRAMQRRTC